MQPTPHTHSNTATKQLTLERYPRQLTNNATQRYYTQASHTSTQPMQAHNPSYTHATT